MVWLPRSLPRIPLERSAEIWSDYKDTQPDFDPFEGEEHDARVNFYYHADQTAKYGRLGPAKEPAVLSLSRESRKESHEFCYSYNSFSIRFDWRDLGGSLRAAEAWIMQGGLPSEADKASYIRRILLEGCGAPLEGVEFNVEIKLTDEAPFYSVNAEDINIEYWDMRDLRSEMDVHILQHMQHLSDLADGRRFVFCTDDLCMLARIFVQILMSSM